MKTLSKRLVVELLACHPIDLLPLWLRSFETTASLQPRCFLEAPGSGGCDSSKSFRLHSLRARLESFLLLITSPTSLSTNLLQRGILLILLLWGYALCHLWPLKFLCHCRIYHLAALLRSSRNFSTRFTVFSLPQVLSSSQVDSVSASAVFFPTLWPLISWPSLSLMAFSPLLSYLLPQAHSGSFDQQNSCFPNFWLWHWALSPHLSSFWLASSTTSILTTLWQLWTLQQGASPHSISFLLCLIFFLFNLFSMIYNFKNSFVNVINCLVSLSYLFYLAKTVPVWSYLYLDNKTIAGEKNHKTVYQYLQKHDLQLQLDYLNGPEILLCR